MEEKRMKDISRMLADQWIRNSKLSTEEVIYRGMKIVNQEVIKLEIDAEL